MRLCRFSPHVAGVRALGAAAAWAQRHPTHHPPPYTHPRFGIENRREDRITSLMLLQRIINANAVMLGVSISALRINNVQDQPVKKENQACGSHNISNNNIKSNPEHRQDTVVTFQPDTSEQRTNEKEHFYMCNFSFLYNSEFLDRNTYHWSPNFIHQLHLIFFILYIYSILSYSHIRQEFGWFK